MNILLAFIAFNVIVIVHELGHFIAAKKFGIKVLEFSLFFGPKLFSIQRGETTYSIRLLPILAYVKMEGEEEASNSDRAFNRQPAYVRVITSLGGPFANLIFAAILLTIVFSITGFATNRINGVTSGSPAYASGIKPGDIITRYDDKRVYQPMDVTQFLYISKGKPANIELKRGNETITKAIAPEKLPESKRYFFGFAVHAATGANSNVIKSIVKGTAAEKAGLQPNDRIVRMNDTAVASKQDIDSYMKTNQDKPVKMTVQRNGAEVVKSIVPQMEKIPEQYNIGIEFSMENGNIISAIKQSFVFTYSIIRSVGYSIVWLVTGKAALNQMMGPIGIVSTIGDVVQQAPTILTKIIYLFQISALMSIAIGATQLIPFPMLDGNRVLLIGIEAIRRKPIPPEKEAYITMVGFVLLILFAIYAAFNDILRIVNGG